MAYRPIRSSYTRPEDQFHIDLKMLDKLPLAEKVKAFDSVARQYGSIGREVEFSNQNVSGLKYDLNAPFDDRAKLIMQAAAAHTHSQHPGWNSFDFYVPFKGKSRFDKGAVEGASIYLPGIPGGKVRRATAGDYGYYSEALNPEGQVVFRVGHGDPNRPESGDIGLVEALAPPTTKEKPQPGTQTQPEVSEQNKYEEYAKLALFQNLLNQQKQPTITDQLMSDILRPFRPLIG